MANEEGTTIGGNRRAGEWVGVLAAIVSIGAGLYLFTSESASEDTTVFDALFQGLGIYFIARGMWMISSILRH